MTNNGPGASVRVLLHYAIKGLLFRASSGYASVPQLRQTATCNWASLGKEPEPPRVSADALNLCILVVEPGESNTVKLFMTGPDGNAWSVHVDPLTPDPNPSNNSVQTTF